MKSHSILNRKNIMKSHSREKEITEYLKKERVITTSELAKHLKISWNTAEKYLLEMTLSGNAIRLKKQGVNLWLLK